jgi:hypothetical protein
MAHARQAHEAVRLSNRAGRWQLHACPTVEITNETRATTVTCTAANPLGLSASRSVTVKLDERPPRSLAWLSGEREVGAERVFRGPVRLGFATKDSLSGVATTMYSGDGGSTC